MEGIAGDIDGLVDAFCSHKKLNCL